VLNDPVCSTWDTVRLGARRIQLTRLLRRPPGGAGTAHRGGLAGDTGGWLERRPYTVVIDAPRPWLPGRQPGLAPLGSPGPGPGSGGTGCGARRDGRLVLPDTLSVTCIEENCGAWRGRWVRRLLAGMVQSPAKRTTCGASPKRHLGPPAEGPSARRAPAGVDMADAAGVAEGLGGAVSHRDIEPLLAELK